MSGATTGKIAFSKSIRTAYINQRVGIIRGNNTRYIFYCLKTDMFLKHIEQLALGSAQPNISGGQIRSFQIPNTTDSEQQKIVDYLDKVTAKINLAIDNAGREITLFTEYRTRLISDVVTGKIDVRNIVIPEFEPVEEIIDTPEEKQIEEQIEEETI
ncbi:Type I restriction modification DNA specificity domain protein [Bacteroidales bacterium Barb6]|nr:Type I restriction modification DNA specificity domain protein [Bacteroidales bacterium Barb6]